MLKELSIRNFALIDSMTMEFSPRLNVLTGETGAGKSILIDGLRFVLGERLEVLAGQDPKSTFVEAVFDIRDKKLRSHSAIAAYLEEENDYLILRRELAEGRSRALINGRNVNVSGLRDVGALLIDIHGQYDHQLLFESTSQMELIDRLAKTEELLQSYGEIYGTYEGLVKRRDELKELEEGREREADLLKYQIEEIERAAVEEGEEDDLKEEMVRLSNAEKLHELVSSLLAALGDDSVSASVLMGRAQRDFAELARIDESTANLRHEFESVQIGLEEIIRSVEDYREKLSFDPDRLKEIEERLEVIEMIERKYGSSFDKVRQFLDEAKKRYDELANASVYGKEAEQKIKEILPELKKKADEITEKRKKAGAGLKRTLSTELADLGISHAEFACRFEKRDLGPSGQDEMEFMISPNPGQPLLALRKIVSAGEVSRVMLAMKKALMKVDAMPTLIFDEIDANIGGRLGSVTGRKLKDISGDRQVLLITHLPQIASFADRHFKVTKKVLPGPPERTVTQYQVVEGEERVRELAQMMSGKKETEASLKHAEEMLVKADPGRKGREAF